MSPFHSILNRAADMARLAVDQLEPGQRRRQLETAIAAEEAAIAEALRELGGLALAAAPTCPLVSSVTAIADAIGVWRTELDGLEPELEERDRRNPANEDTSPQLVPGHPPRAGEGTE